MATQGDWSEYDHAACGLLTTDLDGKILSINQTLLDWVGQTRDDVVGNQTFAGMLSAGGRIYHDTHYAPMLRMQGSAREIAFELICSGGQRLPVLVNATVDVAAPAGLVRVAVFDARERRMYERELLAAKERAEESEEHARVLARTLQRTLIPHAVPRIPGLDLAALNRPAGTGDLIGGDFYDVFKIGPDQWMLAVGDVEGKGVDAAVVTAVARHTIRAAAVEHERPSEVLRVVNEVLLRDDSQRFCTSVLIRCERPNGRWRFTIVCAGHPLPILISPDGADLVGQAGTLLGVLDTIEVQDVEVELDPSSMLLVYTDGVSEARRDGIFFGQEQIAEIARRAIDQSSSAVLDEVVASVVEYEGGEGTTDDVTLLAVRDTTRPARS